MGLRPGKIIAGNIRLERLLGMGGMGSVWMAQHLALKTHVAVKFMGIEIAERPESRQRFEHEAAAAAQIKSPHVVHVSDHGITEDGFPYIVMELLEGEDLYDILDHSPVLPVQTVVEIVSQVCKALARAHAKGIVHRDIKPENIFMLHTDDGEPFVKLLDFGIAKQMGSDIPSMTVTGSVAGTPHYMSPEQVVSAREVDHRTDLWSLAVVAYRALTGRVPFDANSMASLGVAIHSGVFEPPTRHRPDLPPSIDLWMARALAREREARFPSAKEMADELRRAAGMPTSVIPPSGEFRQSLAIPGAPNLPTRVAPMIGPDAQTRVDAMPPSTPTRMDATLAESATLASSRSMPLWKPAVFVLATAFAIALFLIARAALRQPSAEADRVLSAPPPAEATAAQKTVASGSLPAEVAPSADPAEPATAPAPRPRNGRTAPQASSTGGGRPPPEPEDYGF